MAADKRLVLAIIDFLNQSVADGSVKADDKEGLEIAVETISAAFDVDPNDTEQVKSLSIKPTNLSQIFSVYLKTKDKVSSAASSSTPAPSEPAGPSQADKDNAEKLKASGNTFMSSKDYKAAIEAYTKAIDLNPENAVYYSNRAAAYSSAGDHLSAIGDAEQAIAIDPLFTRAYHRLGHAQYSVADYKGAVKSFEKGLELDPTNSNFKSGLANAKARVVPDEDEEPFEASTSDSASRGSSSGGGGLPDLSSLAGMMGGGGMPDMASLLNNPQMMAMAQQMQQNGGLASLMQNPAVAQMMAGMQNGQMPDMAELMSNPAIRDLASKFGGGL
ncbi:putative cytoplasm protein [Flagelloscypha sp. PMI_526]|nr:putative cytoplasm protein [Flagelloscypha sp. PMI_526]